MNWFKDKVGGALVSIAVNLLLVALGSTVMAFVRVGFAPSTGAIVAIAVVLMLVAGAVYVARQARIVATLGQPKGGLFPTVTSADPRALSVGEHQHLDRADVELKTLEFSARVGLALIYRNPGRFIGLVNKELISLGFPQEGGLLKSLLDTSLIHVDGRHNLGRAVNPLVADRVEQWLSQHGNLGV